MFIIIITLRTQKALFKLSLTEIAGNFREDFRLLDLKCKLNWQMDKYLRNEGDNIWRENAE